MAAITFKGFRGSVPRAGERLQQPRYARSAQNIKITSGYIEPLRGMLLSHTTLASAIRTIWRHRRVFNGQNYDNWMVWDKDVDAVGSLIAGDSTARFYWTSEDAEPRMSDYSTAVSGPGPFPAAFYRLGIPSPTVAPTVTTEPVAGTVTAAFVPAPGAVRATLDTADGISIGDILFIAGVVGMTDLNGSHVVAAVNTVSKQVDFAITTSQTYTSGGTWNISETLVSRSYAFTFVSQWGEESGPSPAAALKIGKLNGTTWAISAMQTAPANGNSLAGWTNLPGGELVRIGLTDTKFVEVGMQIQITGAIQTAIGGLGRDINGRHTVLAVDKTLNKVDVALPPQNGGANGAWTFVAPINTAGMKKRIYRTEGTSAAFILVAEIDAATTTYNDTAITLLGEELRTLNTLPPPANLRCLVDLPNGCLAGVTDREVCFSEPYMPYSWPVANRYAFTGRAVALCPVGNSVIALTDGKPIMLMGSDPEAMSPVTIETYAPCVSKRGAVRIGGGILYPSHDGLWLASASGVEKRTQSLFRLDEWRELAPTTFDAEFHDGQYFAVHLPVGDVEKKILVLDIGELDSMVKVTDSADHLYRCDFDGELYVAKGSKIYRWDRDDTKRYLTEWTSVQVQLDVPRNFSHAQVHADWGQVAASDDSVLEANQALIAAGPDAVSGFVIGGEFCDFEVNGSNIDLYDPPNERKVQFVLFDGDTPVFSKIVTSSRPFRLPAGFKSEAVRVGINASIQVFGAAIAESTAELAQASA